MNSYIEELYRKDSKELHNKILRETPYQWFTLFLIGLAVCIAGLLVVIGFWGIYVAEVTIFGIVLPSIFTMLMAYNEIFFIELFIWEINIVRRLYKAKNS